MYSYRRSRIVKPTRGQDARRRARVGSCDHTTAGEFRLKGKFLNSRNSDGAGPLRIRRGVITATGVKRFSEGERERERSARRPRHFSFMSAQMSPA
ncbi:hypothetical protein EVAR_46181_1 [Eumeta japonica]|uniref:Uncharacterized protein n=1 Tax=Eumeta variegata TaxID=151549 RepID=A0A4C1Y1K7_EUMVA|nr:hypothetical protein EVAR_46181_1 [Eumeta japonica]